MKASQTIENKLKEAFYLVADSLITAGYPERVRFAYELIETNESVIALEIICSNLYEFECHIPVRAYELLAEVGVNLDANSEYWEILKLYVIGSSNISARNEN
jgi:hypothetical protein